MVAVALDPGAATRLLGLPTGPNQDPLTVSQPRQGTTSQRREIEAGVRALRGDHHLMALEHPTETDPDIRRMLNLLSMLPGSDEVGFWNAVNSARHRSGTDNADDDVQDGQDGGYAVGKITRYLNEYLKQGDPGIAATLAGYLIMFFDHDADSLRQTVARAVGDLPGDVLGGRWLTDVTATAWRVYVEHGKTSALLGAAWNRTLAEKWPDDRRRYR